MNIRINIQQDWSKMVVLYYDDDQASPFAMRNIYMSPESLASIRSSMSGLAEKFRPSVTAKIGVRLFESINNADEEALERLFDQITSAAPPAAK